MIAVLVPAILVIAIQHLMNVMIWLIKRTIFHPIAIRVCKKDGEVNIHVPPHRSSATVTGPQICETVVPAHVTHVRVVLFPLNAEVGEKIIQIMTTAYKKTI
ncbi:MAG: hypothetical protein QF704_17855, partial [Anaerolineales bacterium]|nr:hypothetical protein [Anaerolineales bacterium]